MLPQDGKSEDEIDKKIYKEPKLEIAVEIEKQNAEREKKIIKNELVQDKVDIQVSRESDIKKVQDVFDEVKEEEPLNAENFFIDDNDIFNSEEISNAREFIIGLINRTNFIANAKEFVEESNESKMEIVHPEEKKIEKKEQMSIDDDEERESASVENSLMKKVKIKNGFEGEQRKKKKVRRGEKKLTLSLLRKRWVNIMRKNRLKFTQKEKEINMVKFQMLLKKTMKMLQEKNRQRHKQ